MMAKKRKSKGRQCKGARDGWEDLKGSHQIFSDCQSGIKNGLQPRQSSLILPSQDSCQRSNYSCSKSIKDERFPIQKYFHKGNTFHYFQEATMNFIYIKFDLVLAVYLYSGSLHKNLGLSVTLRSSQMKIN